MKVVSAALWTALLMGTGLYVMRRSTLRELEARAAALRPMTAPIAADAPPVRSTFDPEEILTILRPGQFSTDASASLENQMRKLPDSELEQLIAAASAESATAPQLLIGIAVYAFVAPGGIARPVPDRLVPALAGLPLQEHDAGYIFRHVLLLWTSQHPAVASRWAREALASGKFADSPDKSYITDLANDGAVRVAPVAELTNIRSLPESKQPSLLRKGADSLLTLTDAQAYSAALLTWPVEEGRERALPASLRKLLDFSGFPAASAWLDAQSTTALQKADARITLALADPRAADVAARADWVLTSAETASRPETAARLITRWVTEDHDAAGQWLNTHRTTGWYDAAAAAFATGVVAKEPSTAFDWSLTITEESVRRDALTAVMTQWRKDNPAAALEYLAKSPLPPKWKSLWSGKE